MRLIEVSSFRHGFEMYARYNYFPNQRSGVQGFGRAPTARADFQRPAAADRPRRHDWGQGNVLGGGGQ